MAKVTNFQKRVNKARKLQPMPCIKSSMCKKWGMRSLSDPAKNYYTNIVWTGKREVKVTDDIGNSVIIPFFSYVATCKYADNGNGRLDPMVNCPGNSHSGNRSDVICYHVMGSIVKMVEDKGKTIKLTDDLMKAINLLNLGGKLVKVVSTQGQGSMWGVVR